MAPSTSAHPISPPGSPSRGRGPARRFLPGRPTEARLPAAAWPFAAQDTEDRNRPGLQETAVDGAASQLIHDRTWRHRIGTRRRHRERPTALAQVVGERRGQALRRNGEAASDLGHHRQQHPAPSRDLHRGIVAPPLCQVAWRHGRRPRRRSFSRSVPAESAQTRSAFERPALLAGEPLVRSTMGRRPSPRAGLAADPRARRADGAAS